MLQQHLSLIKWAVAQIMLFPVIKIINKKNMENSYFC